MYNTSDKAFISVNDSMKNIILIGLMIFIIGSLLIGYFLSEFNIFEGTELGRFVFILFVLSEIPILVNYFYYIATRFGLETEKISTILPLILDFINLGCSFYE